MNTALMFSSATDEWSTPQDFYDRLDAEFRFSLDVAASEADRKVANYLGPDNAIEWKRDGLSADWLECADWRQPSEGRACWMNPPYSRGLQARFIAKAAQERLRGVLTVALPPARTDTRVFHDHIYQREGVEIRFVKGRLRFLRDGDPVRTTMRQKGGDKPNDCAPFPSMVVIFRPIVLA